MKNITLHLVYTTIMMMIWLKMMDQGLCRYGMPTELKAEGNSERKAERCEKEWKKKVKINVHVTAIQQRYMTYAYEIVMRYVTEGEKDVKYTMIWMKDKNQYKHLVEFLK